MDTPPHGPYIFLRFAVRGQRPHALPNITSLAATPRRSLSSNNCKARSQLWSSVSTINAAYLQLLQKTKTNGQRKFWHSKIHRFGVFSKFPDTCWFGVTLPSTISSPKVWGSSPHFSCSRQSLIRGSRKGIFIIPIRQIVWKNCFKIFTLRFTESKTEPWKDHRLSAVGWAFQGLSFGPHSKQQNGRHLQIWIWF